MRGCLGKGELDLHALIWTRGSAFQITSLEGTVEVPDVRVAKSLSHFRCAE